MNRINKKIMSLLLCLTLIANTAVSVFAAEPSCDTYEGSNQEMQNYSAWSSPIESYLVPCADNTLMRVQYLSRDKGIVVEYYDQNYNFLRSQSIQSELPLFGGFYETSTHYYLLTGQYNYEEDDTKEVIRITKFDKNWKKIKSAGIFGGNTVNPFSGGCARFAESGNYLLIHTAHEIYKGTGDVNHQVNATIELDMKQMVVTDEDLNGFDSGMVSHSFNQFIQIQNNKIVALDHGDSGPRAFVLIEYQTDASTGKFVPDYWKNPCTYTKLMEFAMQPNHNATGASVGGFEISDQAYLVAGNSVVQDGNSASRKTRNIFVLARDKKTNAIRTNWITNYTEGEPTAKTPQFVKLPDGNYMLLWSVEDTVYYKKIDGAGNQVGSIYSMSGHLSDCVPIVLNEKLVWYTWKDERNTFYEISLKNLSTHKEVAMETGHLYEVKSVMDGNALLHCNRCQGEETVGVPTSINLWWNYEDDEYYYPYLHKCEVGDVVQWMVSFESDGMYNYMAVEIDDPSIATVEPDSKFATGGKLTMLKLGTTTITIYPKGNPELKKSFTLKVIDPNAPKTVTGTISSAGSNSDPVTVVMLHDDVEVGRTESRNGTYELSCTTEGYYTLQFCKAKHVTREYEVYVADEPVVQDVEICLLGDVTGDGRVNTRDLNYLYSYACGYGYLYPYERRCAEITGDGKINTRDLNRLYVHVNGTNPLW